MNQKQFHKVLNLVKALGVAIVVIVGLCLIVGTIQGQKQQQQKYKTSSYQVQQDFDTLKKRPSN